MKIHRITIENVLGLKKADLTLDPITLLAGRNGAGKTSIRDAIELALTGDPVRVTYKKDLHALVHDGCDTGSVKVEGEGFTRFVTLPQGKVAAQGKVDDRFLDSSLCPASFAKLSPKDAQGLLLQALGVKLDAETITAKLIARGHDKDRVAQLAQFVGVLSWEEIAKRATAEAQQARGSWKATTGETYGERKAEVWCPSAPTKSPHTVEECEQKLAVLDREERDASVRLGELNAAVRQVMQMDKDRDTWAATFATLPVLNSQLATFTTQLESERAALAKLRADDGDYVDCPHCKTSLLLSVDAESKLVATAAMRPEGAVSSAILKVHEDSIETLSRSIERVQERIAAAQDAGRRLDELERLVEVPSVSPEEIEQVNTRLIAFATDRAKWRQLLAKATEAESAVQRAETARTKAAAYHKDVVAWEALAADVSPSGVPSTMLDEALAPMHRHMDILSSESGWSKVQITNNLAITYGGRPYGMCSESEQYRADVIIGVALAAYTNGFVVFDRIDVLDIPSRGALMKLLKTAVEDQMIETAIVIGTLKALPPVLPPHCVAYWVENGVALSERAAA